MNPPVAILAGGLAVRLRPRTEKIPKVLIEVAGKPFAVHQVELLRNKGFENIVFCVGFLGEQVEATLKDGRTLGVCIRYSFDGPALLGTGGALRRALALLGPEFVVMYGDSYLECDYSAVLKAFRASGALGLMTVYENVDKWDRSNVAFVDGRIRRYDKVARTGDMKHIDYGLGVLRAEALKKYPADLPLDLMVVYQDLLSAGKLAGFEVKERFYEIGSPEGLEETEKHLLGERSS